MSSNSPHKGTVDLPIAGGISLSANNCSITIINNYAVDGVANSTRLSVADRATSSPASGPESIPSPPSYDVPIPSIEPSDVMVNTVAVHDHDPDPVPDVRSNELPAQESTVPKKRKNRPGPATRRRLAKRRCMNPVLPFIKREPDDDND